ASYQVERKADGSLIFKSTDLSWTSNTQATEVKIGAIIYQIQINAVTGEYRLIASETVQTSEPFVILNGLKYSIASYDGSRFEIVRGPDHYIQKTDGTVEIAGAIYNLSFDAAASRWSFVRAIDIRSSLPAVELGGINYKIEQPAAGDYALVTPDGIHIAFDKNKSIFEIGHVIYDVISNAVTGQVTFTRRSLFNAAGNSIHLLGKDFSVQQSGDGTFILTSGSLSYTSYKPSANQHRLRIGYFTYDVFKDSLDDHLILRERNYPAAPAPIDPALARQLAQEVFWESMADVNKDGVIDGRDRSALYDSNNAGNVLTTDLNRDGRPATQDYADELIVAAMIDKAKLLRKLDVNQDNFLDANDIARYQRYLTDGVRVDLNGDGKSDNEDLAFLDRMVVQENFKNRLRERINT
ncbi:MAG: hypothetical protein HYZ85_05745, partial [Candidatus Omnitrophica bacterium]|nr:hypothetical protein [Candidatus Omnitrophota bacterium]